MVAATSFLKPNLQPQIIWKLNINRQNRKLLLDFSILIHSSLAWGRDTHDGGLVHTHSHGNMATKFWNQRWWDDLQKVRNKNEMFNKKYFSLTCAGHPASPLVLTSICQSGQCSQTQCAGEEHRLSQSCQLLQQLFLLSNCLQPGISFQNHEN